MKRLLFFLMAVLLWTSFAPTEAWARKGVCWNCGEKDYEDDDFLCDYCDLCESCQYNEYVHCPECSDCFVEPGELCEQCGMCGDCRTLTYHCQECDGCAEDVGEICYGCGMCRDCQDEYHYHCRMCGECDSSDGCYECCDICKTCAYQWNVHCYDCGGCLEDGFEMCDECSLCFDCANENGKHCAACSGEFDFDVCCTSCYCCPDCTISLVYHCYACGACIEDVGEVCDDCKMCTDCAFENFTHCIDCEECKPMSVCEECGYCSECAIAELRHCEACLRCVPDDICTDCNLCEECAQDYQTHCRLCGMNHVEDGGCGECNACRDCIENESMHCPECDACPSETEVCTECHYCLDCAVSQYLHCANCEECFESDGGVCDECGYCEECGVGEGFHCPECLEHKDLCDECGYCIDCAESEGFHCPECGECKADDMCESGGEHCRECCEQNEWICEECGVCVEAEGTEKCEDCNLCMECCNTASEDKGCSHNVCVESTEWEEHFCDIHDECKCDCPCSSTVAEHTHNFDSQTHICSICQMKQTTKPELYKQPTDVKCTLRDAESEKPAEKTITFSVGAMGDDLQYTWYTCNEGGRNTVEIDSNRDDDQMFVSGAGTKQLTISVPTDGCSVANYYFCVVSNEYGSVESDKAQAKMPHGVAWKDFSHLSPADQKKEDIKSVTIVTGADHKSTTYKYSDYHYQVCPAEGCGRYVGTKSTHKYGGWNIAVVPTEDGSGAQYKECEECGARFWQQLDELPVNGMPYVISQPQNLTATVPNFLAVEQGWDDYEWPTATFSVSADGEGELTYQWYEEHTIHDGTLRTYKIEDYDCVSGHNGPTLVSYVPEEGCDYGEYRYYCVVSNAKGKVESSKAKLAIKHHYHMASIDHVDYGEAPFKDDVEYIAVSINGVSKRMMQSEYHYNLCDGCMHYTGEKRKHNFGPWELQDKPKSLSSPGSKYRECTGCGAKEWGIVYYNDGDVFFSRQPDDATAKSSAYNDETKTYDVNTVKFTVEILKLNPTDEVTYGWQKQDKGSTNWRYIQDETRKPEALVSGTNTATLTVAVPVGLCCDGGKAFYRCAVTNKTTGKVVYSRGATLNVEHNMKWMEADQFSFKLYSKTVNYKVKHYLNELCTADSYVETGSDTHNYVCADHDCREFKPKSLNVIHSFRDTPYEITRPATATDLMLRRYSCKACGKVVEKEVFRRLNADEVAADIYAAPVDIMQVEDMDELGFVKGKVLSGSIASGGPDVGLAIVYADGTVDKRTIYCRESMGAVKGDVSGFFQCSTVDVSEIPHPRIQSLPAGTLLTNDPSQIKYANVAMGKMHVQTAIEPYVDENDLYIKVGTEWLKTTIRAMQSVSKSGNYYDATGLRVLVEKDIMMYAGEVLPVALKNGRSYIELGTFTMTDCDVPVPEMWIVTNDGKKINFRDEVNLVSQKLLPDGSVTYKDNTITMHANVQLKSIHIGTSDAFTLIMDDGATVADDDSKSGAAIYAAGPLSIIAWAGANVSVSSTRGVGIEAAELQIGNDKKINIDCQARDFAIKTDKLKVSQMVEGHFSTSRAEMAVAPANSISYTGLYVADPRWSKPLESYRGRDFKWRIVDVDTEENVKDFYLRYSPNVTLSGEPLQDGGILFPDRIIDFSGSMKFNQYGNTMTLKNFALSKDSYDEPVLDFGTTLLDTVYVNVQGDNLVELLNNSPVEGIGAVRVNSNVKLIGDGTLRINSSACDGIVIGKNGSLTVDGKVKLIINSTTDNYAVTASTVGPDNKSKLVVGEKATLDTYSKGIANLGDVIIRGNGTPIENEADCIFFAGEVRDPQRIIYPGAAAYTYNLNGDGKMHFANSGDYDEYRFVIGEHAPIRLGELWVPAYESSLNKALAKGISFELSQEGCEGYGFYDPDTKTLYLDNVTSCGNQYGSALLILADNITVVMTGDCVFTSTAAVPISVSKGAYVTFTSEDSENPANMSVVIQDRCNTTGIKVNGSVVFKDLTVEMDEYCAIRSRSDSYLVIENSTIDFAYQAYVEGMKVSLKGVEFEDLNLKYDNHNGAVVNSHNNNPIVGDFKIVLKNAEDISTKTPGIKVPSSDDDSDGAYTIRGERVNDNYRGLIIKKGKKILRK